MVKTGVDQTRRRRAAGVVFAFAVHVAVLSLLIVAAPRPLPTLPDARAISVDLMAPARLAISRPRPALRSAPPKSAPVAAPKIATLQPAASPPPDLIARIPPRPTPLPPNAPPAGGPAGLALRNSLIGCAFSGSVELTDAQQRHCHDMFAAGRKTGSDWAGFGVDPTRKAQFDAAAESEKFLQKPVLTQRPKNGCKPFIAHQQFASLGASRDAYSVSFGCGKTF